MKSFVILMLGLSASVAAFAESDFERGFNAGRVACQKPVCTIVQSSWGTVTVVRGDANLGIYAKCPDAVAHLKALGEAGTCVVDAVTARRNVSCFDQQPTR